MVTQHFCRFLKERNAKIVHEEAIQKKETCLFCNTILSCYNGDGACFSCQDKIRNKKLAHEEQLAVQAEGHVIKFKEKSKDHKIPATFYRECKGICAGNGQTIFGEILPKKKVIILEKTKSISAEGRCGSCGGEIRMFRDSVPLHAGNFKVIVS